MLVEHFVEQAARQLGKATPAVPGALHQLLRTYSFPGNVRELEALVFDAVARHQGVTLSMASFREALGSNAQLPVAAEEPAPDTAVAPRAGFPDRLPTLSEAEDRLIAEALHRAGGNQGVAAGLLGLSRQALNKRLSRRREHVGPSDDQAGPELA